MSQREFHKMKITKEIDRRNEPCCKESPLGGPTVCHHVNLEHVIRCRVTFGDHACLLHEKGTTQISGPP